MSQSVAGRVMPMIVVRSVDAIRNFYVDTLGFTHVMGMVGKDGPPSPGGKQPVEIYLEVEDVDALHNRLKKNGVAISDPLTLQWWGDRTFKVLDPNGYEIWFYTNVAEPTPPQGAKLV